MRSELTITCSEDQRAIHYTMSLAEFFPKKIWKSLRQQSQKMDFLEKFGALVTV